MADEANPTPAAPAAAAPAAPTNPSPAPAAVPETTDDIDLSEAITSAKGAPDTVAKPADPAEGDEPNPPADPDNPEPADPDNPDNPNDEPDDPNGPSDPKERNRRGYAERNRFRNEVSATLDQLAKPQTAEDLVAQGVDPALAEVEALKQNLQRKDVINAVADLNANLQGEANDVMHEYPVFDETNRTEYDADFSNEVESLFKELTGFRTDPTGKFVLQAGPLYKFYAAAARWRAQGTKAGAVNGQRAAERMLASAETPTAPAKPAAKAPDDGDNFLTGLTGGKK